MERTAELMENKKSQAGAPVSGSSRGPGPLMGPVSRDAQFTAGRPWCGADEPEWHAAAVRPTRCGVDEPKERAGWAVP